MKNLLITLLALASVSAFADESVCTYSWDNFEENDSWIIMDERVEKFDPMIEKIMKDKGYTRVDSKASVYSLGIWLKDAAVGNIGFKAYVGLRNKLTNENVVKKGSNILERTVPAILTGGLIPYDGHVSAKRALKKLPDCN